MKNLIKNTLPNSRGVGGLILVYLVLLVFLLVSHYTGAQISSGKTYRQSNRPVIDSSNLNPNSGSIDFTTPFRKIEAGCKANNNRVEFSLFQNFDGMSVAIEASKDGEHWQELKQMNLKPEEYSYKYYDFGHQMNAYTYCRLSTQGNGNRKFYSNVKEVICHEEPAGLSVFPNPASQFVTVEANVDNGPVDVQIINSNGDTVRNKSIDQFHSRIPLNGLERGSYIVRAIYRDKILHDRLTVL